MTNIANNHNVPVAFLFTKVYIQFTDLHEFVILHRMHKKYRCLNKLYKKIHKWIIVCFNTGDYIIFPKHNFNLYKLL